MSSPFSIPRFRIAFAVSWLLWTAFQCWVIYRFGYSLKMSVLDSVVTNQFILGGSLLISNSIRFYLPDQNRYIYLLALNSFVTLVSFGLSSTVLLLFPGVPYRYISFYSDSVPLRIAISFLIFGGMVLLNVLWYTLQQQQENEKRKNETEKLAKDAELFKLRQQLQPHFLFNSLNSINALIGREPQHARQMIQQLADFFRGTLRREDHLWISLQEELRHLQLYLDIEQVRFGHRLRTEVLFDEQLAGESMPAMLLQPIVENAIKYGLYDTTDNILIRITASKANAILTITVTNPYDASTNLHYKGTGFGLQSVSRRLYLLFGRHDLLHTQGAQNIFTTTIKIPVKP